MKPVAVAAGVLALLSAGAGGDRSISSPASILFLHGGFSSPSIELVRADGKGHPSVLVRHALGPRWSPNGKQIAYVRPGVDSGVIFLMRAHGRGKHLLTRGGFQPAWSPDGERIAYTGFDVGPLGVSVINRAGREVRRITGGVDDDPAWSPDGRLIAFHHVIPDIADEIWVVGEDGSGARRVAGDVGDNALEPVWSPNGDTIAFVRSVRSSGGLLTSKIYLVDHDGSRERSLTGNTNTPVAEQEPAWSPDGSKVAFIREREVTGAAEIHVVSSDGTGERTLAKQALGGFGSGPQWSPQGTKIAFVR